MISILFALLQSTALTAPPPPPAPPWTAVTRTDATTGATSTSALAYSADRNARLVVRCDRVGEPVVSIQMRTRAGLAASGDHLVSVSVDGAAPIDLPWEFPGSATMNRGTVAVTKLTEAMSKAMSITVSTKDGEQTVSATFVGPGTGTGIKDVLAACGYELGVVPQPVKPTAK
ncbi:MAG: hypothetical protein B7Y43_16480 [Sphingomonas sp. 28-62-20]|uniref:hypothetical protein n=1 Tax=Sphingomonas sp. 28-62-20 TaxID=1970433 RepID=UPI000BD9E9CA|nr:MAG: hypothetical protein B7Y43_16480 [Sphingomonas sp. 28-62-20]